MKHPTFSPATRFSFPKGFGASMNFLSRDVTPDEIALMAASSVSTFEVIPPIFHADSNHVVRDAAKALFADAGKRVASIHIPYGYAEDISDPAPDVRAGALALFRAALADAVFFGSDFVVVHGSAEPRAVFSPAERAGRIARLRDSLRLLEPDLRAAHLRAAVEYLPRGCIGNTVDELLSILGGLPPDVFQACLDVNHCMDRFRELPAMIRRLAAAGRLLTLHISDYSGIDECHWLPGKGVIDWPAVLHALAEVGYSGTFNYEIRPSAGETCASRLSDLDRSFAWMRAQAAL